MCFDPSSLSSAGSMTAQSYVRRNSGLKVVSLSLRMNCTNAPSAFSSISAMSCHRTVSVRVIREEGRVYVERERSGMHSSKIEDGEEQLEDRSVVVGDLVRLSLSKCSVQHVQQTQNRLQHQNHQQLLNSTRGKTTDLLGLSVESSMQSDDSGVHSLCRQFLRSGRKQRRSSFRSGTVLDRRQAHDLFGETGLEDVVELPTDKGRDRSEQSFEDLEGGGYRRSRYDGDIYSDS